MFLPVDNTSCYAPEVLDAFFAQFHSPEADENAVVYIGGDPATILE